MPRYDFAFEAILQMLDEQLPKTGSVTCDPERVERRRPGRRSYLMPELLRLLRREVGSSEHPIIEDSLDDQDPDQLKPFTGVLVAVGVSIPLWMTIAGLLYYLI
jgi:hypothetical protein